MNVADLALEIGAAVRGAADIELSGCASLEDAGPGDLSFLSNPRYTDQLASTRAGAVVLSADDAEKADGRTVLIAEDPYFAFRQALVLLHGFRPQPEVGISPKAFIDDTAEIGDLCTIRPFAYIAPRARIGDRVVIYPNCYIGKDAVIGNDCVLHPGVTVYDRCVLGQRVVIHANSVIGEDGLGYASSKAPKDAEVRHHKLPQTGNAVIEDDVEIGACCTVDRATIGRTVVGAGTKFSNHVVIGHGARIGRHNLFVSHVGVAGSTTTGDYVTMGGHAAIAGHLTIGSHVEIAGDSKVMHDIPDGVQWGGTPAMPLVEAKRIALTQKRLPEMLERLKKLERRVAELDG